jgi:UDP-N-acetylglucosamine transferase subunit ALG13
MIFVAFGNVPLPFLRLAKMIAEIAAEAKEDFFVQAGHTDLSFSRVSWEKFLAHSSMLAYLKKAEVVISHGGYGTLSEAVKMRKKVVAVPRLAGEHNHSQLELVEALEKEGYLLGVYNIADLKKKIAEARTFIPREFKPGQAGELITKFIKDEFIL